LYGIGLSYAARLSAFSRRCGSLADRAASSLATLQVNAAKAQTFPIRRSDIRAMGFLRPNAPPAPPAPPPPVIEDTSAKAQDYQDMLARRRGRAAAILTDRSQSQAPQTASKVLLGG
jgi:hypothetical protein